MNNTLPFTRNMKKYDTQILLHFRDLKFHINSQFVIWLSQNLQALQEISNAVLYLSSLYSAIYYIAILYIRNVCKKVVTDLGVAYHLRRTVFRDPDICVWGKCQVGGDIQIYLTPNLFLFLQKAMNSCCRFSILSCLTFLRHLHLNTFITFTGEYALSTPTLLLNYVVWILILLTTWKGSNI